MIFKSIIGATCACLAIISFSANAVIVNTLNSVNYEWLELTETAGLSRNQIELRLADPNDTLYGYEYASRSLIEDLFLSYSSWDGLDGWHGDSAVVSNMEIFLDDFGRTVINDEAVGDGRVAYSVDGYTIDGPLTYSYNIGLYGQTGECPNTEKSCVAAAQVYYDVNNVPVLTLQSSEQGWDSSAQFLHQVPLVLEDFGVGSYLVRPSVVPIPSAVWLFGSGLICLIGFARRKSKL